MAKQYKVIVNTGKADNNKVLDIQQGVGDRGQSVRIKAQAGAKYELQEVGRKKPVGPDYIKAKRVGKDLHILFEDERQASLIIEDYYEVMPEGYNGVIGQAENGSFYEYIPEDPKVSGLVPMLGDGAQAVSVALGGAEVSGAGAALGIVGFSPLLGLLGLGAAGGAAYLANRDKSTAAPANNVKTALVIDPISGDNLITVAEGGAVNYTVTGKVTGAYKEGDEVSLKLGDKTYKAKVKADGTFSTEVPMADLKADADTKIEGSVTGTGGDTATAAQDYQVETEATAGKTTALMLDPITPDNLIGPAEKNGNIDIRGKVTGKFAANDVVSITVNDKTYTGLVNAQGNFSIPVPATDLLADRDSIVDARITGTGGSAASAVQDYGIENNDGRSTDLDSTAPTIAITSSKSDLQTGETSSITFTLSEASTDFDKQDVTVIGGVLSNFQKSSTNPLVYTATFTPNTNATSAAVIVSSGRFSDAAGNTNEDGADANNGISLALNCKSDSRSSELDSTAPTIAITSSKSDLQTGETSTITFTLSEASADFDKQDVTAIGGSLSNFQKSSTNPLVYTATFTPNANATSALVMVSSGRFSDSAGNTNEDGADANNAVALRLTCGCPAPNPAPNPAPCDNNTYVGITQPGAAGTSQAITGTGEPGAVVTVRDLNNNIIGSTTVSAAGAWSLTPAAPVPAGTITASARDAAGNNASANASNGSAQPIDIRASLDPSSDSGTTGDNKTNDATPTISGTAPVGSAVQVQIRNAAGVVVATLTPTVQPDGTYKFTVPTNLADGTYTPVVTVTPTSGNPSTVNGTPFTIDTSTRIDMTNAGKAGTTDPISGTAEPGASVVVKDPNGNVIGTTTADASGNWSIKPANPVPAGEIRAEATDAAGNTASDPGTNGNTVSLKTALNIDPIATDNVLLANEQGASSYTVTGKVTGQFAAGDLVTLSLNGKSYTGLVANDGRFSIPVSMADLKADADTKIEGSITATGGDKATAAQDYTLESANTPTQTALSINPVTADNIISADEVFAGFNATITGTVTGKFVVGDVVTLTVNNKTFTGVAGADGKYSIAVPVSDLKADADTQIDGVVTGSGGTLARAIQDYGIDNTGTSGGDLSSASDSGSSNSDNLTKQNTNLVINGKGAPNSSVDVVIKDANGNTVYSGKASTDANGNFSYSVPGPLPDGQYTPFMNGAQGEPFTIDTNTRIDMTNAGKAGTTDPISGTAEPGASVVVKDPNGNVIGTTTADASGNWSIKPASPVPAGEIRAEATDAAGNTASDPGNNGNNISLKTALSIDPIATDNVLTLTEQGTGSYNVTGKVTGKYATGDLVEFALNGKTYAATVAADGSFSAAVSMADLKADADTKIEGSITATGGDKATAAQDYTLESANTPTQTALSINPVTADNIINAAENTGAIPITGKVTGKYAAGDVVTLSVNGKSYSGLAAADGSYSINVPASDLAADSDTQIDGVVTGSGGTLARAIQDYGVDNSSTPTPAPSAKTALHLEPITANLDNILSPSEGASTTITVRGFASGTFAEGDMVSLVLNGRTYTALVDNNGNYSVSILSADLKADADKTIEASITGTGGSAATAAQTYQVETASNTGKITALSIDPVTSDNMLGSSETTGNIPVSGYVSGAFSVNDTVTLTINGKTFTGKPDSSGFFSIDVPATDLSSDSDTQVEGVVTGTGGTTARAVQDYGVDSSFNRNINPNPSGDTTPPTIEVERLGSGTLTSSETIRFKLSEASTTFNQTDVTVTGGTLSQFTPVPTSGTAGTGYTQYTATFTPAANASGTATIGVAAGKFTDNAGNQNLDTFSGASGTVAGQVVETNNLVSIAYNTQASPNPPADTTAPSIIVARAGSASLASGNTELITFTLSENSSTFTLADIDVSGGTLSGFAPVPGSGSAASGYHQYTAVFTPAANSVGTATIGVAAGQFTDVASNANTDTYVSGAAGYQANNLVSIGYNTQQSDTTKPSIEVTRAGSGTVTANETIYFTLSEASTTFTQDDIDVTGGTLSNFAPVDTSGSASAGYTQYTATFTPSANASGSATIGVDAAKFTDAAGNANADTYSTLAPEGVTQEDNNQVVLQYNTRINPLLPDTTAPTIAITADKATLTAGQTAQLSFVLSEPSTDFAQSDVQVSGGTLGNWVQVSPTQYSATFTPTAGLQGTGSVSVASGAFRDAANNPNADGADTNNTVNFITNHGNSNADTTAPTIAIARMGSGTLTSSETLSFTLSEASTTFGLGDITVTGGTLSQFTPVPTSGTAGSGYTHYTATFTPAVNASGTATIGVAAGKFSDNAGNQNLDTFSGASGAVAGQVVEANNLVSIAYNTQASPNPPADTTAPTIVVDRATTSSLATGNTELITFTLSENSSNFTLADIDVSGGTLSGFAPVPSSGTAAGGYHQYTAVFTPAANSVGTATIGVAASKFSDAAGNANQDDYRLAGAENLNNQVVIAYNTRIADTTAPTIEVTRAGSGTVTSSETIYFTLSEASTTFAQSDIDVTGGTLSNFTPVPSSGTVSVGYTQYTATFTASAGSTGTATIGVVSGKFTDAAGNNNQDTYVSPAPVGATTEANNQVSLNYNTSTNPTPPVDTTAPTIAISADKATLAAGQSATVSFVLSEPSSDFIQTDVQVTGGMLSNWTQVNASTYTATYTAAAGAQGTGRISVASNAFRDAANNFNADGADANNTVDFITNFGNNGGDTTPPTIVVARTSSGTLTSSETLTFTLSEAATNFAVSDIDVTGGTLSNFSPVPTSGTPGTGYTQYTATFTPTANASGSATIGVAAGQFTDNAGNANQDDYRLAGAENTNNLVTIAYNTQANPNPPADSTAPSIVVARAGTGSLTSGGTDTITFTLSENASTFNLADIDVVGGVLSNFAPVTSSGSASTGYHQYTATFTPTANASGSATIGVAAGKFSDAAGNANQDTYVSGAAGFQANNLVTIGYNTTQPDTTAPTIEVTRAGSGTVGSTGETIYFTLSEASTTFTLADIDVTGGTVSNLVPVASSASGTGYKQYTATFTPSAGSAGTATIGVASGKFTDLSGNANTDTYVSPAPAGAALEANNQVSLSYNTQTNPATPDTTAPSIAVTIDKTVLSAGQSAVVTFTLSEASTSFAQSDVDVTGGALSGWTQVSASVYTATFTPTANTAGTATIGVKSGTFSDTAGNLNADTYLSPAPAGASTESNNQVSLSYNAIPADTTAPSIIVSRTNAGTTLAAGANETITFKLSEASLDFDISDVVVTGGTLSSFTPVPTSGTPGTGYTEYTASFTPSANSSGTATIGVAAGRFSDNAGNKNTDTYVSGAGFEADNQVSLAYNTVPPDTTAPKIALTRKGSGSLVAGGSDEITFVLSESSTSFTLADIDVVGGTLTNFAPVLSSGDATRGYTDYTATFTPTANSSGLARIGVQSGKFTDTAGNANLDTYLTGVSGTTVEANNVIDITYNTSTPDTTAPSIVVSRAGAGMVSTSETIYFTLSEASTTFTQSDIDVQGGTLSGFAPVLSSGDATNGHTQYTATFTPTANSSGVATVGVKSGTFSDMAGNANADTYMSPAPSGATFETNNQVSLNFNTLVPDTTSPTIAIDRSGTGVVTGAETITFTLSEASTNFIASDIDVSGGTLSNFLPVLSSGNASTGYTQYTATFTPTAGTVGSAWVAVASGKFTDAASNTNLDTYLANVSGTTREANNTVEFSVNTDTTAPSVAIARANGQTTQAFTGAETITFSLSEDSSDFSAADVVVTGGTLSNFSGSGRTYSATFTPTANASGTVSISVAHNTFSDAGGNANKDTGTNPAPAGATYEANNLITAPFNTDSTPPTVIVTRTGGASGTVTGAESITFTFSEAINPSSFVSTDIDAVGGSISNLLPDLSSGTAATGYSRYSATFTPTAGTSGTGSVGILATKFTDVAGNPNADSYALTGAENANNQVSFAINTSAPDTTPPTIAITRAGAGTVTGAETIYFTLSEASTDFAQADIDVSGGSLSNFQQSSTNPLVYSATFTPAANSTATATIGVAAGKFKDAANNTNLDTYSGAPTAVSGQVVEGNNQLSLSVNTDTTAPTIVVARQGSGTVTGPITVSFTLSESSTNFTLDDIDAVGGTVSNLQGSGTSYTATFTPTANAVGTASVGVASSKFSDAAGNANLDTYLTGVAGTTTEGANTTGANIVVFQYATDTTRPTVAISSNKSTLALGDTAVLTLQFNEPVTDIAVADFTVSGGAISNLVAVSGTNNTVYTATYTPAANSTANSVISIASDKFSDAAGNFNADGADANNTVTMTTNTVAPDTTAPTVIVTRANGNTTQSFTGAETIAFTFSEAVSTTSFVSGDIDAVGGTLSNLLPDTSTGSASAGYTRYTATFTPTTAGTVSVGVDASRFADAAGNSNIDTYRSGISGTTQEANNQVSATYVPPATNATATIDILGMSTDAGTSATDFKTNDQTLSFNGSITNWISTNGDRVMLEVYDADPTSGTFGQVLTTGFATPAANGTWTWDNTSVTRAAGLYTLKATIVSATGTTALNSTAPVNGTNGGWDNQAFTIDTTASNSSINLGVSITTDASNDGNVSTAELGGATTFTSRASFNSSAKAGDKIIFSATNDGTALTPVTVTLTSTDITNGYVETTFAVPADSKTQVVTVNLTDNAGNVATDAKPTDSARLDTTAPSNASVGLTLAISTDGNNDALVSTAELASASTFTSRVTVNNTAQVGDKVVISATNGSNALTPITRTLSANDISNGFDVTFAKPAEGQTQTVTANYVDAAGNAATDTQATDNAKLDTTAPTNTSVGLTLAISTDGNNDALVSTAELNGASTFTSRVTVNNTAQVGDKVVISATNGSTALTPITKVLTDTDISNGFDVTFAAPADGVLQTVTANYVDAAGNAATDTQASDNATLRLANNTTATIDITTIVDVGTTSGDTGTFNNDFVTSDQTLTYKGTITGWVAGLGDRVMLQFYDNNSQQIGSNAFVTPAADGSWTWNDTATTRPAGTYSLKATIVSSSGTTALNSTAPTNGTGGGYDQQVVVIDTAAANSDVSLAVSISTDADNNTWVNASEIGSSSTFTSRATFNGTAKAGDKVTFSATNDGTALTPVTVTLSSTDITNGYVETTFTKPADGKVQNVTASYTDLAGNAAAGTVSDSATLDTTTPTIIVARSGSGTMIGTETITFTISEASTDFAWDAANQTGDIVVSGGTLGALSTTDNITYTATFTPTANSSGTASIGVAAGKFKDAAGNFNLDTYDANDTYTGKVVQTDNRVSATFNTVPPTTTITQINGDGAPLAAPTLTITDATTGTAANSATTTFTFTFDQAVKGFTAGDVTISDSNGGSLTLTPTGTWADGQTVFTGTVTAPASGAGAYAVTVADGSYQSNSGNVPGYGNSNVQAYAASQDGYSSTASTTSGGNGDVGVSIALSNGNYIWSTNMGSGGLSNVGKAQIFNSSGGLITSSLTVPTGFLSPAAAGNVSTTYYVGANNTSYAALPGGGFVVAYTDDGGGNTYSASIWVVKYDNNGTMVSTSTQANTAVVTNAYGSPGANGFFGTTSITPTANGNYVLTYARATAAGDPTNAAIYAVEIDGSTNAIVAGRTPSLISAASFDTVAINGMDATTLADGKIVVSWAQEVPDGVFTRVLNADGTPLAGSSVMQSLSTANQYDTINTIATPDGGFVIVSADQTVADNAGYGVIKAIKYTVSGSTVTPGTVTTVSTANVSETDNNKNPAAAVLTNGNIVVTWENQKALSGAFYRIYDASLNPISPARNIPGTALSGSTLEGFTLSHTVVTALPDGGFVIGVSGSGTTPTGVNTQQVFFSADGAAISRTGSTASDTQIGGDGADTLTGGGGADVILAGAGNDTVVINASNISNLSTTGKLLDGGTGIDTLRMGADASTLDLSKSAIQANVQNFEKIDLGSDAVVNTVILNATAVQRLATQNLDGGASSNKQLIIDGTSSDLVKLSGQWNNGIQAGYWQQSSTTPTRTVGGVTYKVYTIRDLGGVEVLVNNAITTANTDLAYPMASGDIITLPNTSAIVGDLETAASGGSTGTGDGGSQQPLATSSTTSDVTPLVQGTLSQALSGTQVLKLYRTNVTDGGAAVEVSANVTTSGTNWQFQDSGLVAGKQYRYEARIMDGNTLVDASNTYTINQASTTAPDTTPPTVAVSRSGSNTMIGAETITFTLSEASTDFAVGDVVFSGGTLTNFAGSGTTYTATFTPTANSTGTFQVGVQASAFKDAAGNFNTDDYRNTGAENTNNQVTDSFNTVPAAPVISMVQADGAPVAGPTLTISDNTPLNAAASSTVTFNFEFSQAVSGFQLSDISFINASTGAALTGSNFTGSGSSYTAQLTMPASGSTAVLVQVRDGAADLASNTSIKATGDTHLQTIGSNATSSTFESAGQTVATTGSVGEMVKLANGNHVYLGGKTTGTNGDSLNNVTLLDPYGKVLSTTSVPDKTVNGSLYQGSAAPTPDGGFAVFSGTKFWLFGADGVRTSPVEGITYTTSATAGGAVSAMGTADGKFVVAYADLSTGVQRFFYKVVDATGADVGSPMALSPVGSVTSLQLNDLTRSGGSTSIVKLNDGKIAISYASGTQAGNIVLDANGGTVNPPTSLTVPGAGPLTTIATQNGGFATAFSPAAGEGRIYRYSSTGAKTAEHVWGGGYMDFSTPENLGLAQLTDGRLIVSFLNNTQNSSHWDNQALIFDDSGNSTSFTSAAGLRIRLPEFNTNALMATPDGGFVQIQDVYGAAGVTAGAQDIGIRAWKPFSTGGSVNKSSSSATAPLFGSNSADELTATGVYQVIEAGAGDDTITVGSALINSLALAGSINGDTGTDTLALSASNFTLDLSKPALINAINGIEKIDLGSNQSNTVVLNVTEALSMAAGESQKRVFIDGDSTSAVKLSAQYSNGSTSGSWSLDANTSTINGVTYKVYNYSGDANVKVLVNSAITSVVTDYVMSASDIVTSSSAGTLTVGDIENAQNASSSDQTTDTTPLIKGSIASLPAGATLSLTRTDVTGSGSPVNLGNLTLDSNNQWFYQETTALQAGKRYKYVAVLTLANSTTVASNDYSIDIVAAGSSSATESVPTPSSQSANPPTLVISDNQSGIAKQGDTVRYYFNFDEAVTGFEVGDISAAINNSTVTVSNFTKVSDTFYTADVANSLAGPNLIRVQSGSYTDTTGISGVGAAHVQLVNATGEPTWKEGVGTYTTGITGRAITLLDGSVVYLSGNTSQNALTILDANGKPAGTGAMTNTTLNGTIHKADVTALSDGGFAVLSGGQLQTFNADGTTRTAAVSYTTGAATNSGIDAAQLSDGKFMLFYYNTSNSFCYKIINTDGSDAVTETVMGPAGMADGTGTIKGVMDAVVLSDGRVAVAFAGKGLGGYQFFSATGSPVGVTQTYMVEGNTLDMQAVALANGGFAVGAIENRFVYSTPSSYSTNAATLFKVDADQTRSERKLLQSPLANPFSDEVGLAALPDGKLALAFGQETQFGSFYVYDQNLNHALGLAIRHDGATTVHTVALAGLESGNVVAFSSTGSTTTGQSEYRIYSMDLNAQTINGTTNADTLIGSSNDDTIIAAGGSDRVVAGAGNDTVAINASNVTNLDTAGSASFIDGGEGINTLRFDGAGVILDLTNVTVGPRVSSFSNYDISGSGANALTLNVSDVLSSNMTLGTKAHVVKIDGDANDVVTLSKLLDSGTAPGTWSTASTTTISGTTYNVYNYSGDSSLQVLIDNQIVSSNVTLS
jgi:hypothetical protein